MEIKLKPDAIERAREELRKRKQAGQVGVAHTVALRCSKTHKDVVLTFQRVSEKEWRYLSAAPSIGGSGIGIPAQLTGTIDISGFACPHCGASGMFKCRCGKLCCYRRTGKLNAQVTCAWCSERITLDGVVTSLDGSAGGKGKGK